VETLIRKQYYISLVLFTITNLGIFSRYSEFFYQEPVTILMATVVAFILAGMYLLAGLVLAMEDRLKIRSRRSSAWGS
jgi:bile acid:Na+ symporter, BASS family